MSEQRTRSASCVRKVDDLLGSLRDTDDKIATIESQRKMVEEVQARANGIVHMLQDLNVNVDLLSEQRAAVDQVGEKLARLEFTLQEANSTMRALQREREAAEQGIKALRTRVPSTVDTKATEVERRGAAFEPSSRGGGATMPAMTISPLARRLSAIPSA